jgi:hypothetical protein
MTMSIAVAAAIAGMCLGLAWLLPKSAPEEQHLGRIWLGSRRRASPEIQDGLQPGGRPSQRHPKVPLTQIIT